MKRNILLGAFIVLVGVLLFVSYKKSDNPASTNGSPNTSSTLTAATTTPTSTPKATNTSTPSVLSYNQAIAKYGNMRMQFDPNCGVSPSAMVLKTGTSIMLDNRYSASRNITIGGTRYSLGPYGFRIVTIRATTFPKVLTVDCGTGQNNAQITVVR